MSDDICSHCGDTEVGTNRHGLIANHNFPKFSRALCPGSNQKPLEPVTIDCRLLRCMGSTPHFLPFPKTGKLPRCPFDGDDMFVEHADTWSMVSVYNEAQKMFLAKEQRS